MLSDKRKYFDCEITKSSRAFNTRKTNSNPNGFEQSDRYALLQERVQVPFHVIQRLDMDDAVPWIVCMVNGSRNGLNDVIACPGL